MDIHKINYCQTSGFLLKNDRIKHDLISDINSKLGFNPLNLYEKSYSDRLISVLKTKDDILATYISYGKYVFLYLTKIYNENVSLIIEMDTNKDNMYPKIISVPCSFHESMYEGTLIYGEIFRTKEKTWHFLAEKLYLVENNRVSNDNNTNIGTLNTIIDSGYFYTAVNPFKIQVKKYFNLNEIEASINELSKNNIPIKGIKFYGLKTAINFYFNTNHYSKNNYKFTELPNNTNNVYTAKKELTKLMEEEQTYKELSKELPVSYLPETFYLELRKTSNYGIYELYARTNDKYKLTKVGKARVEMIEMSQQIINDTRNRFVVMCKYNYIFKKFDIIHIVESSISEYDEVMTEINKTVSFALPNYVE